MPLSLWRKRIEECLAGDGPEMVFQPIYDIMPNPPVLCGYEALARFEDIGVEGPHIWFEAAELVGLDFELEMRAIENAIDSLPTLDPSLYLSVNVSPATLVDPRFPGSLMDHSELLSRVVFELTEHKRVPHYPAVVEVLSQFNAQLAIDDLGTGFASMQHVIHLRPNYVKLDIHLIRDINEDYILRSLVGALVTFAIKSGLKLVAEGVETPEEYATLRALDVHTIQGYLLGRPGPLPERTLTPANN